MLRLPARARTFAVATAVAIVSLGLLTPVPVAAEGGGPTTWHITVGPEQPQGFTGLLKFYPSDVTVHPGDTVEYVWAGFHTATFNPPANKSVLDYAFLGFTSPTNTLDTPSTFVSGSPAFGGPGSAPPPPFDVSIGQNLAAGSYHFKCMLHIGMNGTIHVTNRRLPSTDAQNKTRAKAQIAADLAQAAKLDGRLSRLDGEDNGIQVGARENVVELTKFYPSSLTVHSGEAVTFTDPDRGDPHTVTFGPDNRPPLTQLLPYGNPGNVSSGDRLSSGYLYSRQQFNYWNLGIDGALVQPPTTEYTTTFNNPGTTPVKFAFYCELHGFRDPATGAVFGMSGYVTVLPAKSDD
jgi:plastocyanin